MGIESLLSQQIIGLSESIDDRLAALLVAGTGITLTYNDGAGTLTIANTGLGGSTGSTDNRILRADGTGGATVQNSAVTIDDSGNISSGQRLTLNSSTYLEATSSSVLNLFHAGVVRVAISSGEITATGAIRLTGFNPAVPDIGFVRNATGPTAETRAAGGLRVRTADGSAAGAIDCGAITASGTSTINSIPANGGLVLSPSSNFNAFYGVTLTALSGSAIAAFLAQPTSGEIAIGATNGGGYYPVIYSNGTARLSFATTGQATFSHVVTVGIFTVATLPSVAANAGALAQVTDSSVTTNGSAVSGSGSNRVVVFSNGSTWDVVVA